MTRVLATVGQRSLALSLRIERSSLTRLVIQKCALKKTSQLPLAGIGCNLYPSSVRTTQATDKRLHSHSRREGMAMTARLLTASEQESMTFTERMQAVSEAKRDVWAVVSTSFSQYGDDYGHVRVTFGYVDPTRDQVYPSGFASYDGVNAGLEHIRLTCQIDGHSDITSYGWASGISAGAENHAVQLHELEAAVKMLKRMERGMEKVQSVAGAAASFGQFVAQHCAALKVKGVLVWSDGSQWSEKGWRERAASDVAGSIDYAVQTIRVKALERKGKQAAA